MKSVGICIATYNSGQYLEALLDSIDRQIYRGIIRVLVVDDCSTDDTVSILEKRGIEFIRLNKNSGSCAKPYNIGLSYLARSCDYLYKVDSDDRLREDAVSRMAEKLEESGANWVNSYYHMFGESSNIVIIEEGHRHYDFADMNKLSAFAMWTVDCWNENKGFREDMAYEDWELWARLLKAGYTYSVLREPVYFYRTHPAQESRKQGYRHEQAIINIRKTIYG